MKKNTDPDFLVLLEFVEGHWETMTDGQIARVFRTASSSVLYARKRLGLKRGKGIHYPYS